MPKSQENGRQQDTRRRFLPLSRPSIGGWPMNPLAEDPITVIAIFPPVSIALQTPNEVFPGPCEYAF